MKVFVRSFALVFLFVAASFAQRQVGTRPTETGGPLLPEQAAFDVQSYDIKLNVDQAGLRWDALEDSANQVRRPVLEAPLFGSAAGDFLLADRDTFHRLRGFNEVYRAARAGIDLNFMVKVRGAGIPIQHIGGPVYHLNHIGSMRISKSLHQGSRADSPWGDLDWHSSRVTYNNPDGWGLAEAPPRRERDGSTFLDFDWRAVPPIVELRRVVLPSRVSREGA